MELRRDGRYVDGMKFAIAMIGILLLFRYRVASGSA